MGVQKQVDVLDKFVEMVLSSNWLTSAVNEFNRLVDELIASWQLTLAD